MSDSDNDAKQRRDAAGAENLRRYRESEIGPPNFRHGVNAAITRAAVPESLPGAAEVRERVQALIADAVSDLLGGESEVTAGRRAILASQRLALTVLELASRYLGEHGLLDAKNRPHPLLSIVNSYANTCRLNALSLGLERRQKSTQTLESVIEEYADKKA